MKLTFDEAIENHRKMWNWIAEETEKKKSFISKSKYFKKHNIKNDCFCCEYTANFSEQRFINCELCPIDWGVGYTYFACENVKTPYRKWREKLQGGYQSTAKYAREIANLSAREEVRNGI